MKVASLFVASLAAMAAATSVSAAETPPDGKPTSAQFATFSGALEKCTHQDGRPIDAEFRRVSISPLIETADATPDTLVWHQRTTLAEYAGSLLFPAFPGVAPLAEGAMQYGPDADSAFAGMNGTLAHSLLCPADPAAALPILQWLADDVHGFTNDRSDAHGWLGLTALHGVGRVQSADLAREHFLKFRMFTDSNTFHIGDREIDIPYFHSEWWSDGQDDDVYANIQRAGLEPYLKATMDDRRGYIARRLVAMALVKTDPDGARALLQQNAGLDALTLMKMEQDGLLPLGKSDADIAYWAAVAANPASGKVMREPVMTLIAERNGGTVPVSSVRPSPDDVFAGFDVASKITGVELPEEPVPYRVMVTPQGQPLFALPCATDARYHHSFNAMQRQRMANYLMERLRTVPTVTVGDTPVYGWVIIPGPYRDPQTGLAALAQPTGDLCTTNPMEKLITHRTLTIPPPAAPGPDGE